MQIVEIKNAVEFNEFVLRRIVAYSMGFVKVERRENQEYLRSAGSGTFVRAGAVSGILTAAHVVTAFRDQAEIGIVRHNRKGPISRFAIPTHTIDIESLGPGPEEDTGPDLAFVKLAPATIASLEAQISFHNLERYREKAPMPLKTGQHRMDAIAGVIDELTETTVDYVKKTILVTIEARMEHGLVKDKAADVDFDYLHFTSIDGTGPSSYAGTSGGALWRTFTEVDSSGIATPHETVLLGVVYFQSPPAKDGIRTLTCHGPRSIYQTLLNRIEARWGK